MGQLLQTARILLLADGELGARAAAHLRDAGLEFETLRHAETLLARIDESLPAVIVAALCQSDLHEGMALIAHCRAVDAQLPLIALAERNDATIAVEAVRKGAYEVVAPEQIARLAELCRRALRSRENSLRSRATDAGARDEAPGRPSIDQVLRGQHQGVVRLRQTLLRLARIDADVLVRAETGCGKEVIARCLHDYGPRAAKPFVAINCGAIPENIFESELFGHEAGAFTGAAKRRIGKLEHAAGGTVFLDEIESLPLAMQVKLLRALQQRTIERVGGNEQVKLSCRVVVASKDDLLVLAREGRFRLDLYYRLNVVELAMPPLRERRDDIPLLADAFAHEAAERHGLPDTELDVDFVCGLMAQEWPGNVRELRNAVERHVLGLTVLDDGATGAPKPLAQQVADFERALIEQTLRMCQGSVTRVCEVLSVPRKTLYDKFARLSVDPAAFRGEACAAGQLSYAPRP
jgi:DNA-binding NtrC family response regulator